MVQGLNIGKNALIVNQAALTVVGNNIANMNTEGYSKQRVNLSALHSNRQSTNVLERAYSGYGVTIESISRYRDSFTDQYYRDSYGTQNYYDIITSNGSLLEDIANEFTDSGLSKYLNSFFAAANNVSLYPTDVTMKTDFIQQAKNLASELNSISTQLNNVRTNLVGDVNNIPTIQSSTTSSYVTEINQLLKDIATVNESIIYQYNTNTGSSSGLLDDRDALLDKLSAYIPISVEENTNGGVNVSLGNLELIGGNQLKGEFVVNLGDVENPSRISFESESGDVYISDVKDYLGQSGKLGAVLTLGGNDDKELSIKYMLDNLDLIANQIAEQVNSLQLKSEDGPPPMTAAFYNTETGQLEKATEAIFISTDGSPINASNITINPYINNTPKEISTAYVEVDPATGEIVDPTEVGNNTIAQAFCDLRDQPIAALKGLTIEDFNTTITTDFGSKLSSAKTNYSTASSVYEAAGEKRSSTIGVNVEEELMDLIKYQRAYEASARVFSTSNEILETLVNLAR